MTSPGSTARDIKLCGGSNNSASNLAEEEEAASHKYLVTIFLLVACRSRYRETVSNLKNYFAKGQHNYSDTMTGVYAMVLVLQTNGVFPVGGGDKEGIHFVNIDGGNGRGAPALDSNGVNAGRHRGERIKKTCYECGSEDHLVRDCPVSK